MCFSAVVAVILYVSPSMPFYKQTVLTAVRRDSAAVYSPWTVGLLARDNEVALAAVQLEQDKARYKEIALAVVQQNSQVLSDG